MKYKLIYVNTLGFDYRGNASYEFIFCDDTVDLNDVWGEGWDEIPADGNASPPELDSISKVGILKCKDYTLECVTSSISFGVCDAKDGIIALAWEAIDENFDSSKTRLVFKYGDDLDHIEHLLKLRKLKLIYED